MTSQGNPLFQSLKSEVETELNRKMYTPPRDTKSMSHEDRNFLNLILRLISEKKIELFRPSSLFNEAVYEDLTPEQKVKAEVDAQNLLAKLRSIKDLHDAGFGDSFQMNNLVHSVRLLKERMEQIRGDIFII